MVLLGLWVVPSLERSKGASIGWEGFKEDVSLEHYILSCKDFVVSLLVEFITTMLFR